jgi:3-dehydroquinate dehydratase II
MTARLLILNGPNLNRLGKREPAIYGTDTLAQIQARCEAHAATLGMTVDFRQSNFEGAIVESIHEACDGAFDALIINPAGYSFSSIAILDALKQFDGPKLEVHLSNIPTREAIYHHSLVSKTATAVIAGLGAQGYIYAVDAAAHLLARRAVA